MLLLVLPDKVQGAAQDGGQRLPARHAGKDPAQAQCLMFVDFKVVRVGRSPQPFGRCAGCADAQRQTPAVDGFHVQVSH